MQRLNETTVPTPQTTHISLPQHFLLAAPGLAEELWPMHPTLSEAGLAHGRHFVNIKGDPSLRETALSRRKYVSCIDRNIEQVLAVCQRLLASTDCYSIYLGFNSSEVRTESIFRPFSYEIHDAEWLVEEDYLSAYFTEMPFEAKMNAITWVQNRIHEGPMQRYKAGAQIPRPRVYERFTHRGFSPRALSDIIWALGRLRSVDDYYLRNAAISLSQGVIRATFNCDGTYVIPIAQFNDFVSRYFEMSPY